MNGTQKFDAESGDLGGFNRQEGAWISLRTHGQQQQTDFSALKTRCEGVKTGDYIGDD